MLGEYRSVLLTLTLSLLGLEVWAWFFKDSNMFPGLETRTLFVLVPMLVLTAIAYIDVHRIRDRMRRHGVGIASLLTPLVRMHDNTRYFFHISFQGVLVVYLLLLLASQFVDWEMSLNYLLILVIGLGVVTVLIPYEKREERAMTRWDVALIIGLAVIGGVLIFIKTADLGWLRYVISALSALLIGLLGFLVFEEDDEEVSYPDFSSRAILPAVFLVLFAAAVLYLFMGVSAFRIVLGSVYVLFVPGLVLSYVFFDMGEIDSLERIALSFALSIAVVPLLVFYLNLIGMRISALSVSLVVLGVVVISYLLYRKKEQMRQIKIARALHGRA